MKFLLALLTLTLLALLPCSSQGKTVAVETGEFSLKPGEEKVITLPDGKDNIYLSLEGRMQIKKLRGGCNPVVEYFINGKPLIAANLINYRTPESCSLIDGRKIAWYDRSHKTWRLVLDYDFSNAKAVHASIPADAAKNAYLQIFNIGSLLKSGGNILTIKAVKPSYKFTAHFRNIKTYSDLAAGKLGSTNKSLTLPVKQAVKIAKGKFKELNFTAPNSKQCLLIFDARMLSKSVGKGGSFCALRVNVNGADLSEKDLYNYARKREYPTINGQELSVYSVSFKTFRVNYSPDFKKCTTDASRSWNPLFMPDFPYVLVFDISKYVKNSRNNSITLTNNMRNFAFPIFVQNIRIADSYNGAIMQDSSVANQQPLNVIPKDYSKSSFGLEVNDLGRVKVKIGDSSFDFQSFFSYPEGKFNGFASSPGRWNMKVKQQDRNTTNITGLGKYHKVERQIKIAPNCIKIKDTIYNLTNNDLGVVVKYQVPNVATIKKINVSGVKLPTKRITKNICPRNSQNPTIFVATDNSGLGMSVDDDAMRANLFLSATAKAYSMENHTLTLAPKGSYTTEVTLYPINSSNYFDFINAARLNMGLKHTLQNLVFAHAWSNDKKKNRAETAKFIKVNKPYFIGLQTSKRCNEDGTYVGMNAVKKPDDMVHGPALMTDYARFTRADLLKAAKLFHAVDPQLKLVAYFDIWLNSEPDSQTKYQDSLVRDRSGNIVTRYATHFTTCLPTLTNSSGRAIMQTMAFFQQNNLGLFFDEGTLTPPVFSYNTGWDGYTGEIDMTTFKLKRKIQNNALASLAFRVKLVKSFTDKQLAVIVNGMPSTRTFSKLNIQCFFEHADPYSAQYFQPISWGSSYTEHNESDIARTARKLLSHGCLYQYYAIKYSKDKNFIQDLYPITPLELHAGYIIGKNKIITSRSGRFGWGNNNDKLTVKIYNSTGYYEPTRKTTIIKDPKLGTVADLQLKKDEMAIIFRGLR